MRRGGGVLNQFFRAAAVLALLAGPSAMAQIGGSVGGSVGGTVGGQINRSFNPEVGGNAASGGGGAGGGTQSHQSASSWAPTRSAVAPEESARKAGGMARAGAHEEAPSSQTEMKKEAPKTGAVKKFGAAGGSTGTSSFGMASKRDTEQFGFSGKMKLAGVGSNTRQHERTEAAKFGRDVAGHQTRGGRHKHRGREYMPKLRSPVSNGDQGCANASSLSLCTSLGL